MGKSSHRHKLAMGYENTTYQGSNMRNAAGIVSPAGATIVHTAPINTTVSTLTMLQAKTGETFTWTIVDPAAKFNIQGGNLVKNIAANVTAGSYPVDVSGVGNLGTTGTLHYTITST